MVAMHTDASFAAAQTAGQDSARQELQAKLAGLGGLNGRKLSPEAREKKLREACEGFESIFIQKMWQEMRKTVPQNGFMHGREEHFWQDMYDQELAKKMTSAGGIGLAEMMHEQLSRNLVSASRTTVGAMPMTRAFVPEAAPLLPESAQAAARPNAEEMPAARPAQAAPGAARLPDAIPSIYDGVAPIPASSAPEVATVAPAAAQPAATPPNPALTPGAMNVPVSNPDVERALAVLRAEQSRREPGEGQVAAEPVPGRRHAMTGLEQANMVRREAGDQLGSRGIRAPLKPQTERAQMRTERAAQEREAVRRANAGMTSAQAVPQTPAEQGQNAGDINDRAADASPWARRPASAQETRQGEAAQASPRPSRRVRYTTNMPQKARKGQEPEVIRMLQVDGAGQGGRAGAGIAAYHENRAQAMQGQGNSPGASQGSGGGNLPHGAANPAGAFSIPPLTAGDLHG